MVVMLPTVIWFAAPAPNDVLRTASETPVLDAVASLFQALTIGSLCFIINGERGRLRLSPLIVASIGCVVVYYLGWVLYYYGNADAWIILLLTVPPCAAFLLFATDRKNLIAALFAACFALCHLKYSIVNYIL